MNESKVFVAKNSFGSTKRYAISRSAKGIIALDTTCTHEGCAVDIADSKLVCSCHLAYFDPFSGSVESGPAPEPLKKYVVSEREGSIFLEDNAFMKS